MTISNVNIGTGPSTGNGDPLRLAFNKINDNFAILSDNISTLTNSVTSVAGRSGNVILTVQDIVGINNYATTTQIRSISYTPTTTSDWSGTPPTTMSAALDRLAALVRLLNGSGA